MAIKHTLVQPGDIIKANYSWRICDIAGTDSTKLHIQQNFRTVRDISKSWKTDVYPTEDFVMLEGPTVSENMRLMMGPYPDDCVDLREFLQWEAISVVDKTFIVTKVESVAPDRFNVTAVQFHEDGTTKPRDLTVMFNQQALAPNSRPSVNTGCVHEVRIVGNKPLAR